MKYYFGVINNILVCKFYTVKFVILVGSSRLQGSLRIEIIKGFNKRCGVNTKLKASSAARGKGSKEANLERVYKCTHSEVRTMHLLNATIILYSLFLSTLYQEKENPSEKNSKNNQQRFTEFESNGFILY